MRIWISFDLLFLKPRGKTLILCHSIFELAFIKPSFFADLWGGPFLCVMGRYVGDDVPGFLFSADLIEF